MLNNPFLSIEALISNLGGTRYFTTLDASKGYLQVEMLPSDQSKTAFLSHSGLFEVLRMPFAFSDVPATFQRLVDQIVGAPIWNHASACLDDIVMYSRTFEEHLVHLRDVLRHLRDAEITLHPEKAQVGASKIDLLGFTIDRGSVAPNTDKLRAILEFRSPTNVKSLRRFLGMVSYYRKFIVNCASIQAPLSRLMKRGAAWHWGDEEEAAKQRLCHALADTASLRLLDPTKPYTIHTDASDLSLGAALLQESYEPRLELRPVAFARRVLTPVERNYTVAEKSV